LDALERQIATRLTRDYWTVTLPSELGAAGPKGPEQLAFFAAQVVLKAPVLFSNLSVAELLDPYQKGKKRALERHHLFPRAYLKKQGYDDRLIKATTSRSGTGLRAPTFPGSRPASTLGSSSACTSCTPFGPAGTRWNTRLSWKNGGGGWPG